MEFSIGGDRVIRRRYRWKIYWNAWILKPYRVQKGSYGRRWFGLLTLNLELPKQRGLFLRLSPSNWLAFPASTIIVPIGFHTPKDGLHF